MEIRTLKEELEILKKENTSLKKTILTKLESSIQFSTSKQIELESKLKTLKTQNKELESKIKKSNNYHREENKTKCLKRSRSNIHKKEDSSNYSHRTCSSDIPSNIAEYSKPRKASAPQDLITSPRSNLPKTFIRLFPRKSLPKNNFVPNFMRKRKNNTK